MEEDELTLSDVHVGRQTVETDIPNVVMTRFLVKNSEKSAALHLKSPREQTQVNTDHVHDVDEDGDLVLERKTSVFDSDVIYIYHAMSTKLKDVGLQVWAGCLLLCDFIISHPEEFWDKNIIELGAGTGLASIVAAEYATHVFCTDIGEAVLDLCEQNIEANNGVSKCLNNVTVKELDWQNELQIGSGKYDWSLKDFEKFGETDIIIAADVIYNFNTTQDFFNTIQVICKKKSKCDIYIALEKRLNFTLTDLEVSCPAYNFFLEKIQDLIQEDPTKNTVFMVRQEPTDFLQYFEYDRTKYLELWYISAESKCGTPKLTDFG